MCVCLQKMRPKATGAGDRRLPSPQSLAHPQKSLFLCSAASSCLGLWKATAEARKQAAEKPLQSICAARACRQTPCGLDSVTGAGGLARRGAGGPSGRLEPSAFRGWAPLGLQAGATAAGAPTPRKSHPRARWGAPLLA